MLEIPRRLCLSAQEPQAEAAPGVDDEVIRTEPHVFPAVLQDEGSVRLQVGDENADDLGRGGLPIELKSDAVIILTAQVTQMVHWQLDVNFAEDDNRLQKRNAVENLALLRRLTLSLLKAHPSKDSIARKSFAAALDPSFLEEILRGDGILEER
jgi:hypothetical protein